MRSLEEEFPNLTSTKTFPRPRMSPCTSVTDPPDGVDDGEDEGEEGEGVEADVRAQIFAACSAAGVGGGEEDDAAAPRR